MPDLTAASSEDFLREEEEELPDYMYCQPCAPEEEDIMYCQPCNLDDEEKAPQRPLEQTLDQQLMGASFRSNMGLHSIDEDGPLQDGQLPLQPPPDAGLDELPFELESVDVKNNVPSRLDQSFQSYVVSRRPDAVAAALSFTQSFGTGIYQPLVGEDASRQSPNEVSCLGHKETIYGIHFSPCGNYLASASQDATIRIWDVAKHRLLQTLTGHSKDSEVLRVAWALPTWGSFSLDRDHKHKYLLASGGADGVVKIWSAPKADETWTCIHTLDHGALDNRPKKEGDDDPPQTYALQFINHWKGIADGEFQLNNFLMTSSDDFIHLWEIEDQGPVTVDKEEGDDDVRPDEISLLEVMSIRFTCMDDFGFGVTATRVTSSGLKVPVHDDDQDAKRHKANEAHPNGFGGERNPNNIIYVFDASYCPANGLLGVALSDGSLRLVNGRGVCVCPITLPGNKSHLTSFGWDALGQRMASCVATGQLILWSVDCRGMLDGHVAPTCRAILEGGHVAGRPLYGAAYCGGESQDLVLSWGVDGRLCLWDSHSHGQIHQPLSTLVAKSSEYPIFAVDIREVKDGEGEGDSKLTARIAAGGGTEGGFVGVPMYLFDVTRGHESSMRRKEPSDEQAEESESESDEEAEPAPADPSAAKPEVTEAPLKAEPESKAEPDRKVEAEPASTEKADPALQQTEPAAPEAKPSETNKEGGA